eukprot:UN09287
MKLINMLYDSTDVTYVALENNTHNTIHNNDNNFEDFNNIYQSQSEIDDNNKEDNLNDKCEDT